MLVLEMLVYLVSVKFEGESVLSVLVLFIMVRYLL